MDTSNSAAPHFTEPADSAAGAWLAPNEAAEEAALLIFRLGASLFGVPALAVREILALPALSPLAEVAPFIVGVLNLRGLIVPVMDLSARIGREAPPPRLEDALIVLDWEGALIAILASEVRAVSSIATAQIEAMPAHGRAADLSAPFVAGVLRTDAGIVMLLHLTHLLRWPAVSDGAARPQKPDWTPAERAILQERALRLSPAAAGEIANGENGENGAQSDNRAPVAVVALGGEEFGVELRLVREFASISAVTSVPCCPPHILGQINLRGDIVTLIDARGKLQTAQTAPPFFRGERAHHPVVVVSHDEGAVGIVVDEVRDVLYLGDELLSPGAALDQGFLAGSAPYQGRLLPLLDVAQLLEAGGLTVEENA